MQNEGIINHEQWNDFLSEVVLNLGGQSSLDGGEFGIPNSSFSGP